MYMNNLLRARRHHARRRADRSVQNRGADVFRPAIEDHIAPWTTYAGPQLLGQGKFGWFGQISPA
jgi:hypothetical protein